MALGTPTLVADESTKGDKLYVDQMSFLGDTRNPGLRCPRDYGPG